MPPDAALPARKSTGVGLLWAFVLIAAPVASADQIGSPGNPLPGGPAQPHQRAEVIGSTDHGCLVGGEALPLQGPGYEVVRPERKRFFGHPEAVDFIEGLARRAQAAGLPLLYVGDMALPRGGPMPDSAHHSHQTGLDIDFWFTFGPHYSPTALKQAAPDPRSMLEAGHPQIDSARFGRDQMNLLRFALSDPRVDRIYVDPAIKLALCRGKADANYFGTDWLRRLLPWPKHDDHFHVRLRCPEDSPDCEPQASMPEGDGCAALASGKLPPAPLRAVSPPAHAALCARMLTRGTLKPMTVKLGDRRK